MVQGTWGTGYRKTLVCVDSYDKGIPQGCFYNPYQEVERFESLSQFLVKMETLMDDLQMPQSFTAPRSFSALLQHTDSRSPPPYVRKGARATFEIHVIFRQHTSWQGVIIWLEQRVEQSFRSVLELILLMDSALRKVEGSDIA